VKIVPLLIDIEIPVVTNCGTNVQLKVMRYGFKWLLYMVKDVVLAPDEGEPPPEPMSEKPASVGESTQASALDKARQSLFETLVIDSTGFVLTSNQLLGSKTVVRPAACAEPTPAKPSGSKAIKANRANLESGRPLQALSREVMV
jgi:hypothetical protein